MGVGTPSLSPPRPLTEDVDRSRFACGVESLDMWLKQTAMNAERRHSARTYVVCDADRVAAYYCLANGSLVRAHAPKPLQRNMPDPLPVMVLGRLAVDLEYRQCGLGKALLRDAILRTASIARKAGIVAIVAHAISPEAKAFYLRQEFEESPIEDMTVLLSMKKVFTDLT